MNKDYENLKMLSIGFYVYAGITALFACFPFIHLFVGIAMVSGSFDNGRDAPPAAFGWFFIGIAAVVILMGFTLAICSFFAGKYIKEQKKFTFCFVIAAVNCMFVPFGTLLGVFTIIVLSRDTVKALFNKHNFSQFSSPPNWQ